MIEIDHLAATRKQSTQFIAALPEDQLFRVPNGFNNHIAWNAAHAVAVQQLLHYKRSGLEMYLAPELAARYSRGTGPADGTPETFKEVMAFALEAPDLLRADYAAGRFESYTPYETIAKISLSSIEDSIAFNNFHEGVHLGYMLAQRRALGL